MRYHSTTGLHPAHLRELITRIRRIVPEPDRWSGRPPALSLHRSVLLTLVLLRQNLPQTLAADLFGISQPTVSRVFRRFAPLIGQVSHPHTPSLPDVVPRLGTVLVDGTLIPTGNRAHPDPGAPAAGHTPTTTANTAAKACRYRFSPIPEAACSPCAHHCPAASTTAAPTTTAAWPTYCAPPPPSPTWATRAPTRSPPPRRKRPGHTEHTPADQAWNTLIAQHRWPVERAIAHLKNWKILATGYRARLTELPTIINIVTSLEHYRLDHRHF